MVDEHFRSGKDESGAYLVYRNPRFFRMILEVQCDNKFCPLSSGATCERLLADLEFYILQDIAGSPMHRSVESTLRGVGDVTGNFFRWQAEQEPIVANKLTEGLAWLLVARAEISKTTWPHFPRDFV